MNRIKKVPRKRPVMKSNNPSDSAVAATDSWTWLWVVAYRIIYTDRRIQTIFLFVIFAFCTIFVILVSIVYPLAVMYPSKEGTSSAVKNEFSRFPPVRKNAYLQTLGKSSNCDNLDELYLRTNCESGPVGILSIVIMFWYCFEYVFI